MDSVSPVCQVRRREESVAVCECICVHTCVYMCMQAGMISMCTLWFIYTLHVCKHVFAHMCASVHASTCMFACVYAHMCLQVLLHTCVLEHMYACV